MNEQRRKDDDISRSKLELFHELQISQSELKLQNRELRKAKQQLEESHKRFADLYDYAPVGYLTVNHTGHILSINLTGAALLESKRESLIGKSFAAYFPEIDYPDFIDYLHNIFSTSGKGTIELRIRSINGQLNYVRLESTVMCDTNTCLMIMSDVSQLKKTIHLNRNLLNENRRLMREFFQIQEKERRLLARELHDELGQWLTAIYAENEVVLSNTPENSIVSISAQAIKECTRKMHEVIHGMLHRLRPALLDTLGLVDALVELKRQWCMHHPHIILEFKVEGEPGNLDESINIAIFRIIQEGLNNISMHSEATWAQIDLCHVPSENFTDNFLQLRIEDNGKGYDTTQPVTGFGLLGMRERVIAMGGSLSVQSANNEGTIIHIRLPIGNINNDNTNHDLTD